MLIGAFKSLKPTWLYCPREKYLIEFFSLLSIGSLTWIGEIKEVVMTRARIKSDQRTL